MEFLSNLDKDTLKVAALIALPFAFIALTYVLPTRK